MGEIDELEARFLAAIAADPGDREARAVYADWLDERGDPRGEYLRLEAELHSIPPRLATLAGAISPAWIARVGRRYDLVLTVTGPNKIAAIKAVRAVTGLGLKDAKDLVEAVRPDAPQLLTSGLDLAETKRHELEFVGIGARVVVHGHHAKEQLPSLVSAITPATSTVRVVLVGVLPHCRIQAVKLVRDTVPTFTLTTAVELVDRVIAGTPTTIVVAFELHRAGELARAFAGVGELAFEPT